MGTCFGRRFKWLCGLLTHEATICTLTLATFACFVVATILTALPEPSDDPMTLHLINAASEMLYKMVVGDGGFGVWNPPPPAIPPPPLLPPYNRTYSPSAAASLSPVASAVASAVVASVASASAVTVAVVAAVAPAAALAAAALAVAAPRHRPHPRRRVLGKWAAKAESAWFVENA